MRIFAGLAIAIVFVAWVLYRLYKRDLKQNMQAFCVYLGFVVVWTGIYAVCYLNG